MKVKIQVGQSSIELEGDTDEVETILEAYWLPSLASATGSSEEASVAPSPPPRASSRGKRQDGPASGSRSKAPTIDPTKIANDLKVRSDFQSIKSKILDVPSDWINKCRLVALLADGPITSGDVHRVLNQLRIKNSLPTLSRTLTENSQEFLTNGSNPTKYTLTEAAEAAFKRWLSAPSVAK
jgi:hypothetical protein